jgi:CHAT domain-containing protein
MDEQRLQDYLKLIERFLNCASDQELNEVFSTHRELIDPDFLQVLAQVALEAEAQGNQDAAMRLMGLLVGLAEAVGIALTPSSDSADGEGAAQFFGEILQCIATHQGAKEPVYALLSSNQARLNDGLLAVLPDVAAHLLVRAPSEEKDYVAAVLFEFGNLLQQFPLGQRAINMELAIAAYEQVLEVMTRAAMPVEWATAQMNLATAYYSRIRGDRAENLELAIAAYEQVLEVMTRAAMPVEWAQAQMNLATAYYSRIRGDRAENLELAIAAYEQVLEVRTRAAMPVEWATAQMNLALAYYSRIRGDRAENLEQAIAAYEQVLEVRTRAAMPVEWATAQMNLAIAYRAADRWPDAHTTYAETIDGIEALRSEIRSGDDAKQKHAEEWNGLYQGMVTTCLHQGNPAAALEYAERSKARNLVDLLANRVEPQGVPPATLAAFHNLKKAIKTEELRLQSEELTRLRPIVLDQAEPYTTRPIPNRTQLNALMAQLDHLIEADIRPHDPDFVATQTVEPLAYGQIQALLPNPQTALIEWYIQNDTVLTFVVTQHSPSPTVIALDQSGLDQLVEWTARYLTNYTTSSAQWQHTLAAELHQLAEILQIGEVLATPDLAGCNTLLLIPHIFLHLLPLHALPVSNNSCLLDRFSGGLRYAPCCQLLHLTQQPTRPHLTHLLAIQNPTDDLPFTDVEVAAIRPHFEPQVQVLAKHEAHKAAVTAQTLQPGHALHFACHGYFNWQDPLKSGLVLAGADSALTAPSASRERYIRQVASADLETTCLTLGNLFSRDIDLTHCGLVTLSACETGQVDVRATSDEYIGLPSGFLFAGSPSVVSSLWRVSDISTSFLMVQFYAHLKAGQPVPIALNQAQLWLRQVTKAELEPWAAKLSLSPARRLYLKALLRQKNNDFRPFESPYHWAAFCAVGS